MSSGMAASDIPIFCLMGTVPETFGGMTTVLLQRSSALAELAGRRVEILTKSTSLYDPERRARVLHEDGRLHPLIGIRNVWADLRSIPCTQLAELGSGRQVEFPPQPDALLAYAGVPETELRAADGSLLQTDHFRSDGSRALSNRHGTRDSGRLITAFDRAGQPIAQWRTVRALYHDWVSWVIGGDDAVLLIDSAHTGGLFFDYQRENVTTVQVIHTHHLRQMRSDDRGELDPDVMKMLTHLDWYDGVAVLTGRQRSDLLEAGVVGDNSFVLPNMLVGESHAARSGVRDQRRGVIAARLSGVKRLEHSIHAIAAARAAGVDAFLDIYGEGVKREGLEQVIQKLSVSDHVSLRGYEPHARAQFRTASFTTMTSIYEGQGLVLLEAMAAGCIPICYDIDYGPSDIVTDGVDGFLVPDGDVQALAEAVGRVATMGSDELDAMRSAAQKRSRDYSPAAITALWQETLDHLHSERSVLSRAATSASLTGVALALDGVRFEIDVRTDVPMSSVEQVWVSWTGRGRNAYGRVRARWVDRDGVLHADACLPPEALTQVDESTVLDLHIDVHGRGSWARARIRSAEVPMPASGAGFIPYSTAYGNLSFRHG